MPIHPRDGKTQEDQTVLYALVFLPPPLQGLGNLTRSKAVNKEDEVLLMIDRLASLEPQVVRQTGAFLKWKQAWMPDLKMSIDQPASRT